MAFRWIEVGDLRYVCTFVRDKVTGFQWDRYPAKTALAGTERSPAGTKDVSPHPSTNAPDQKLSRRINQ